MLEKIKQNKIILGILFVALILRLIGFWHGFPFVFHPDEPSVIRSALGIRFDTNPGHFDWPHLHFYLNYLVYVVFLKFRAFFALFPFLEFLKDTVIWRDPIIFYMLSRMLNGVIGALTVIPIYLAGKEIAGKKAGLLAAAIFAIMPLHVRVSHFALIDVPAVFYMSWGVYFSYRILNKASYKNYILAGLFFGLAASTKYNGLFGAVVLVVSHFILSYRSFNLKNFILRPIFAILACLCAFLMGTPYALFDFETFSRADTAKGALWQFTNVGSVSFVKQIEQFFTEAFTSIAKGTGITPVLIMLGFIFETGRNILGKRNIQNFLLTALPALLIMFNVAGFSRQQSHYYLMAYPFIALAFGVYLAGIDFKKYQKPAYLIIFLIPLLLSLHQVIKLSVTDTRVLAYKHITTYLKPGTVVLYNSNDFRPLVEKLKKDYQTKKVTQYVESKKYPNAVWLVKLPTSEIIDQDIAIQKYSNSIRNGPQVYIYFIQ